MTNSKIDEREQSFMRFFLQYLLGPILVAVIGTVFTWQLERAKSDFTKTELELKRIEGQTNKVRVAEDIIQELFSDNPYRAFVAERLMQLVVDTNMSNAISGIVRNYYGRKYDEITNKPEITAKDIARLDTILTAAQDVGSVAARSLLARDTTRKGGTYVVVSSEASKPAALEKARRLTAMGYSTISALSTSGYYAVAIGPSSFTEAKRIRSALIASGIAPSDAFLSAGNTWGQPIYP
jgi:hypothetical protein